MESEDSKHAAGIAYIVDDELLCVKSMSGRCGIPKGHRHVDETPEEGARREFTEETQIIIEQPLELSHIAKKKNGGDFHVFICKGVILVDYPALVNPTKFNLTVKKDILSNATTKL